jgi:uncharacterized protein
MMKNQVILDTSPLVALINKKDNYHQWVKQQWTMIKPPLLTCEAVISESCFLLNNIYGGQETVIKFLEREVIKISFDLDQEINAIKNLLICYQSVPISLADACLVRMAELNNNSFVFTLDSDFLIYRKNRNQSINLIYSNNFN